MFSFYYKYFKDRKFKTIEQINLENEMWSLQTKIDEAHKKWINKEETDPTIMYTLETEMKSLKWIHSNYE